MAYPQPSADDYVQAGFEYFRLVTTLTSPGDIYESTVSSHALALGPTSDLANVNVAYFDGQVPTFVNLTQAGPNRTFVGQLVAQNNTQLYAPTQRPGRILIWPSDLFDPTYLPSVFNPGVDSLTVITPVLDVIQYFSRPDSLAPSRVDKTYRFPKSNLASDESFFIIPFWGRRYACARIINNTDKNLFWTVFGINYTVNPNHTAFEKVIDKIPNPGLVPGGDHTTLVRAGTDGLFDALMFDIEITAGAVGSTPFEVITSDTPA